VATILADQNGFQGEIKTGILSESACYRSVQNLLCSAFYVEIQGLKYTEL